MRKFLWNKRITTLPLLISLLLAMPLLPGNSQTPTPLLDPVVQAKFVNPLPIPAQIDVTNGGTVDMYMEQTQQWLGLMAPTIPATPILTTVWGYGPMGATTYPGPTFRAKKNVPAYVNWYNNLPGHFLPVDASLHMAHPEGMHDINAIQAWYNAGNTPTVPHLHGGHTESASDGLPEAWYTQNFAGPPAEKGAHSFKTNYVYDNTQEAATLWYHDHALGITRLNVNAGLAGFYLLEDKHETKLISKGVLPKRKQDIEIVIQDRCFWDTGELFWPANPDAPSVFFGANGDEEWNAWDDFIDGAVPENGGVPANVPRPSAVAEFFGDFIIVNGMAWPYLDVEPRPYRFRLLNGSDSRFYILKFENEMPFLQIASDDGLLPNAVELTRLIIAPGERAEVVVDFSKLGIGSVRLLNLGPDAPFGDLPAPDAYFAVPAVPSPTQQIMQFNVNKRLTGPKSKPLATVIAGTPLGNVVDLVPGPVTRKLGLFEGSDIYGRLNPLLGALNSITGDIEPMIWDDPITELPDLNAVETWEVYNFTGDAHPVHLHLVAFQIVGRSPILDYGTTGFNPSEIVLGPIEPPAVNEVGWKDTFIVPPGYVGILKAKFDLPGRYVWHCHILSHEDHEMMRPFEVMPPAPPPVLKGASVEDQQKEFRLYPNPASELITVDLVLEEGADISISIYGLDGRVINSEKLGYLDDGIQSIAVPVDHLDNGMYILELKAGNKQFRESIIISK